MQQAKFTVHRDLGDLEVLHTIDKQNDFGKHNHSGYTLALVDNGAQRFYRSGAQHFAPTGSVILINAEQIHDCRKACDGIASYRSLYPTPELYNNIMGSQQSLSPFFKQAVINDKTIAQLMHSTFTALEQSDSLLLKQSMLIELFSHLCQRSGNVSFKSNELSAKTRISSATNWLLENLYKDMSVSELAAKANMSSFQFIRQFKQHVGLTPHAFQIQHRLNNAKALIRKGLSITEVATTVGFYDQSHFNRHFKRNMGITPNQYKQAC